MSLTVLLCLALAYPPPDPDIRDYLSEPRMEIMLRIRYHAFLWAVFRLSREKLTSLYNGLPTSEQELASLWRSYLQEGGVRRNFHREIVQQATDEARFIEANHSIHEAEVAKAMKAAKAAEAAKESHPVHNIEVAEVSHSVHKVPFLIFPFAAN